MGKPTKEFRGFIFNILRYRCHLKDKTITKYFDTDKSWDMLQQAFIHKSLSASNYEKLEFEGDVIVNTAVVQYLVTHYNRFNRVMYLTRIKHTLISKKVLSEFAIKMGFANFVQYDDELKERFNTYDDPSDADEYTSLYEDTFEALCGAINHILNTHLPIGVGFAACYNLVTSALKKIKIPVTYEEIVDPKSRLKEIFDMMKWSDTKGCNLKKCVQIYDVDENSIQKYIYEMNKLRQEPDPEIVGTEKRFMAFVYACVRSHEGSRTLLSVKLGNNKTVPELVACKEAITKLKRIGIFKIPPDPEGDN